MTTTDTARPRVRRGFLKWSGVVFALLMVLLALTIWDYFEVRRLNATIAALARSGEPTSLTYRQPKGEAGEADRAYRAAAVLAEGLSSEPSSQLNYRLSEAMRSGTWPADVLEWMRSATERHRESIALAERASRLPFEGFRGYGSNDGWFNSGVISLTRVVGWEAILRAFSGDAARAADMLFTEAQLQRNVDLLYSPARLATDVRIVAERARLPAPGLATLAASLETLDRDDQPKRAIQRARMERLRNWPSARAAASDLLGPWWPHQLNRDVETMTKFVEAAGAPWPERLDRVVAAGEWPMAAFPERRREAIQGLVIRGAEDTSMIRAIRVIVAVERYRRDHGEQLPASLQDLVPAYLPSAPLDPFSGKSLVFAKDARGYLAYSVGPDRRDDGGRDLSDKYASATAWPRGTTTADRGLRINLQFTINN